MTFIDMTNEEWEEVRRQHDAMVQMGQLELQAEEVHDDGQAAASLQATAPVGRKICNLDDMVVGLSR